MKKCFFSVLVFLSSCLLIACGGVLTVDDVTPLIMINVLPLGSGFFYK